MPENINSQRLIDRLTYNYEYLNRQYRLGNSDNPIGYVRQLNVNEEDPESYWYFEFCDASQSSTNKPITFDAAINDLYQVVKYIETERAGLAALHGELLLRCKCLIYEAADYILKVPEELGKFFVDFAEGLPDSEKAIESLAETLNGGSYQDRDKRAKVIKLQLMAAIWGANQLYREHIPHSYDRAFVILKKVDKVIRDVLPRQHDEPRESFGLLGLSQYLTGRVLFRKGRIKESQRAFRRSADAYLARLRQKEEFYDAGRISSEELEEKVSVTIRRASLVTAFGHGYHHFVGGQLTRALESLTLARAALTRNSGRIYLIYVDMLYWACRRARESSNRSSVSECVLALRDCRNQFKKLVPDSSYFHRAGIQLSLALLSRRKLTGDVTCADYNEGLTYLNDAIEYAGRRTERGTQVNPRLLATAYVTRSRFFRSQCSLEAKTANNEKRYGYLKEAQREAEAALKAAEGIRMMQAEAFATLAEVHTDLVELNLVYHKLEFQNNFEEAFEKFRRAMFENRNENPRYDAVCLLGLTRLCLLNPNTEVAAQEYFAQWQTIENVVEHDYCATLAKELPGKFSSRVLLIKATNTLRVEHWQDKLANFLLNESLKDFVGRYHARKFTDKQLRTALGRHLRHQLGYVSSTVGDLIDENDLLTLVSDMMNQPVKRSVPLKKKDDLRR